MEEGLTAAPAPGERRLSNASIGAITEEVEGFVFPSSAGVGTDALGVGAGVGRGDCSIRS